MPQVVGPGYCLPDAGELSLRVLDRLQAADDPKAARALVDVGANTAGTVLNSVNLDRSEYKYSHYYYYRKDGYYAEDGPVSTRGGRGGSSNPPREEASQPPS